MSVTLAPASTSRRIFAHLIDQIVVGICYLPVSIPAAWSFWNYDAAEVSIFWLLMCFAFQFVFQWYCLYFLMATPGKWMMGLRVVSIHGDHSLGLFQSFLRLLADHLSLIFSHGLRALALFRFDRRHVSDWIAETQVIHKGDLDQMYSVERVVKRRWILAPILCWYFSSQGIAQAYYTIKHMQIVGDRIIISK